MKKISRSHRKQTQRGGFPFGLSRKTTPASRSAEASRHFVNRSATPCCDARGGIAHYCNLFTLSEARDRSAEIAAALQRKENMLRKK